MMVETQREMTTARAISTVAAAWILSLGVDLLLHGGLLAGHYVEPSPFLLDPQEAFRRIPFGYLTFLILTIGLYWLIRRLGVRGAVTGFHHGAAAGAVVWGALVTGLYSISTATGPLLVGWWIGQALELGLAGAVIGSSAAGARLGRVWALVALVVVGCLVTTVTLQTIGWAPTVKVQ
jgi:hypothetical protein